ncbi:hypothetical protein D9V32_06030 [Mycetocola tolaasinivorans]|uniref:Uncharacterized protein n=1 Tax=Mycetocola tolaasinivorans TaxID=76635 RepID=A0A3L7A7Y1_9MICO|nr:hypothetical protein [Mycetocola tolaasinivorans]RLP76423.1 hypothetical protein D9V32_06030 [Mycetocola tolaasinivorans]
MSIPTATVDDPSSAMRVTPSAAVTRLFSGTSVRGALAGVLIVAIAAFTPPLIGTYESLLFVVMGNAPAVVIGAIIVAHGLERIRLLSNSTGPLVIVSAVVLGSAIGTPMITLTVIQEIGRVRPPSEIVASAVLLIAGGLFCLIWVALGRAILTAPTRGAEILTLRARRIIVVAAVVAAFIAIPTIYVIINVIEGGTAPISHASVFIPMLMLGPFYCIPGYVIGALLLWGLIVVARIGTGRDEPEIRSRPESSTRAAGAGLTLATLALITTGWMLSLDRIAEAAFNQYPGNTDYLTAAGIPRVGITVVFALGILAAVAAWMVRRSRRGLGLILAAAVLATFALTAAWTTFDAASAAPTLIPYSELTDVLESTGA